MAKQVSVGIADMKILRQDGILITYALGSCIGISFYDAAIKLGALLHIMLPESNLAPDTNILKYADTGIKETLRKLNIFGGLNNRMVCKIAGGAKMFEMKGAGTLGSIGERNALMVKKMLRSANLRLTGEDTGSNYARTMQLDVTNGEVKIRSVGKPDKVL